MTWTVYNTRKTTKVFVPKVHSFTKRLSLMAELDVEKMVINQLALHISLNDWKIVKK